MKATRDTTDRAARLAELTETLQGLLAALRRVRGREAQQREALSFAQWRLLRPLAYEDELNATALSRAAELAPATVTAMLDQLVTAGIVERTRCDADRRVVQNRLTAAGLAAWRAKEDELREKWTSALADLTDDELEIGARVLTQLRRYFEAV